MTDKFKMNDEQKKLFDDLTRLQQQVALNSISGMSNIDSYKNSNGKAKTQEAQEAGASEILRNPQVKAFVDSMKGDAVSDAVMSRQRMMELQTKIADIDSKSLDNMSLDELTEVRGALDVKLKAMKQLAELAGYDAPTKSEVKAVRDDGTNEW